MHRIQYFKIRGLFEANSEFSIQIWNSRFQRRIKEEGQEREKRERKSEREKYKKERKWEREREREGEIKKEVGEWESERERERENVFVFCFVLDDSSKFMSKMIIIYLTAEKLKKMFKYLNELTGETFLGT